MNTQTITRKSSVNRAFYAFGTLNYIRAFGSCDENAVCIAMQRVLEIEGRTSLYKEGNDIAGVNANSGKGFTPVHHDVIKILSKAKEFSKLSEGAFDITIHPLSELWKNARSSGVEPSEKKIGKALSLVSYKELFLNENSSSAALRKAGQAVDLSGMIRGYAADEAKRILAQNNVGSAIINIGGNVVSVGTGPNGEPWQACVPNPLSQSGQTIGTVSTTDKAVSTYINRHNRMINPQTGRPVQTPTLSVTAVCASAAAADALSTALFTLGIDDGMKLLKKADAQAVFITADDIIVTAGLAENFKFVKALK